MARWTRVLVTGRLAIAFDRVLRLAGESSIAPATAPAEREAALRSLLEAYQNIGFLRGDDGDRLYCRSAVDDAPTARITTFTLIDGELLVLTPSGSTSAPTRMRLARSPGVRRRSRPQIARPASPNSLGSAARLSLSSIHPTMGTMRPAFMAAEHFEADFAVGTPRAEHIAFYRRAFGATLWRPPRDYPGLTAKLACVGADYRLARQFTISGIPFLNPIQCKEKRCLGRASRAPPAAEAKA